MDNQIDIRVKSDIETKQLGQILSIYLEPGMCIPLIGKLGTGKTTFVQGVANGLNVPEQFSVSSPSFTLINRYVGDLKIYHADLYRLNHEYELEDLEIEDLLESDGILFLEWPELVLPELKEIDLLIYFFWDMSSEFHRDIRFIDKHSRFDGFVKRLKHDFIGN